MPSADVQEPPFPRPTRAIVDLDALAENLEVLRGHARGQLYGVVKADAYGHGLLPVARRLAQEGVDGLCVALVEEGLELRRAGVAVPILVLNAVYGSGHRQVIDAGLTPVVYTREHVEAFAACAGDSPVFLHLKVDTGMARLGAPMAALEEVVEAIERAPALRLAGLMTHLSSADTDASATAEQLARFDDAVSRVRARGHGALLLHAANSAGTLCHPGSHHDMVRVGLALYGVPPVPEPAVRLRPVMSWHTEIASLRVVRRGDPVGYDQTWRAPRDSLVATLPLGYGDGLMVAASNRATVLIGGKRCPLVGRVSMDLTGVDVSELDRPVVGDPVVLLGEQAGLSQSATDLAAQCGTIPYEILTSVSPRVPRIYRP